METRKYLPMRAFHLILITAGIVLYVVTLLFFAKDASALSKASSVLSILALVAGFVYLALGYKKDANLCYKLFMWLFMVSKLMECTCIFSMDIPMSTVNVFITLFTLVIVILLGAANDYGKIKTNIISISLVAINIYSVISAFTTLPQLKQAGLPAEAILLDNIGQLIIASTAALMVCGKYLDKAARGRK